MANWTRNARLARRTPLRARLPLRRRTPLASKRKTTISPAERDAMLNFRRSIVGARCIVCGRTHEDAFEETGGYGHQAHHGIRRQVLRRLGVDEWASDCALPVCAEPCHRRHTSRKNLIPRAALPVYFLDWCWRNGLTNELAREYPS